MKEFLAILFFSFGFHSNSFIRTDGECLTILKKYIKKMESFESPQKQDVSYFMDMEYKVTMNPKFKSVGTQKNARIRITSAKKYYSYETENLKILYDLNEMIVITDIPKQIVRSSIREAQELEKINKSNLSKFQEQMLEGAIVLDCRQKDAKKNMLIRLKLNPKITAEKHIDNVSYEFDERGEYVKEVIIFFSNDYSVSQQKIIYHSIDFNYKGYRPQKIQDIIIKNDKLLSAYKGYKLIDNRTKNR